MRLAKFLAHSGVASRRAAEDIVRAGRVTVGGETVTDPARDVEAENGIAVDGKPIRPAQKTLVLALHKPAGVVSTAKDTHDRPTVLDLAPRTGRRLYPVGRLDADTTGLILLTDDGELAHRLTHPRYEVTKTYRARVANPPVTDATLESLREGVLLDDGMTAPAAVERLKPDLLLLELHEGRKRQVKRMCEAVGHPVRTLTRTRFGPLSIQGLPEGAIRPLTAPELRALRRAAGLA